MYWLSFCFYCGGGKEWQTLNKMAKSCENNPNPGTTLKPLTGWPFLGLHLCFSIFRKDRHHCKACLFVIQGRRVLISVVRMITSNDKNQIEFWLKAKRTPKAPGVWHWPHFLWKIAVKSFEKERETKVKCQCLYLHRDRNIVVLSETSALGRCDWLGEYSVKTQTKEMGLKIRRT